MAGVTLDWGLRNQELDEIRSTLAQIVDWWDAVSALSEDCERRISFGSNYEPSWLKAARSAVNRGEG
jgi:hypothetical protein